MEDQIEQRSAGTLLVRTGDLDELVTRVTGLLSRHSVTLRAREEFTARVYGVDSADMSMLDMTYEGPVRIRTDPLPDYLAVCVPAHGGMAVSHAGESFDVETGGQGLVGGPRSELVMDWGATRGSSSFASSSPPCAGWPAASCPQRTGSSTGCTSTP